MPYLQVDNRNIAVVMEKVVETPESIAILQAAIDEVMQNGGLPQKLKVVDWTLEAGEGAALNPIGVGGIVNTVDGVATVSPSGVLSLNGGEGVFYGMTIPFSLPIENGNLNFFWPNLPPNDVDTYFYNLYMLHPVDLDVLTFLNRFFSGSAPIDPYGASGLVIVKSGAEDGTGFTVTFPQPENSPVTIPLVDQPVGLAVSSTRNLVVSGLGDEILIPSSVSSAGAFAISSFIIISGTSEFLPSLSVDLGGSTLNGVGSVSAPPEVSDLDTIYRVMNSGNYNGYSLKQNDYVIFYNDHQDLIVIRMPSDFGPESVAPIITAAITEALVSGGLIYNSIAEQLNQAVQLDGVVDLAISSKLDQAVQLDGVVDLAIKSKITQEFQEGEIFSELQEVKDYAWGNSPSAISFADYPNIVISQVSGFMNQYLIIESPYSAIDGTFPSGSLVKRTPEGVIPVPINLSNQRFTVTSISGQRLGVYVSWAGTWLNLDSTIFLDSTDAQSLNDPSQGSAPSIFLGYQFEDADHVHVDFNTQISRLILTQKAKRTITLNALESGSLQIFGGTTFSGSFSDLAFSGDLGSVTTNAGRATLDLVAGEFWRIHCQVITPIGSAGANPAKYKTLLHFEKLTSNIIQPTTDGLAEGSTKLYFTPERVRATNLTGLVTTTTGSIVAGDSVLTALGKLQRQATDNSIPLPTFFETSWYKSSFYYDAAYPYYSILGATTGALGTLYFNKRRILADVTFNQMSVNVTTAAAGSTILCGVYASDANGKPSTLLVSGSTTGDTVGAKTMAINLVLKKGDIVWDAILNTGVAVSINAFTPVFCDGTGSPTANGGVALSRGSQTSLPADASVNNTFGAITTPRIIRLALRAA